MRNKILNISLLLGLIIVFFSCEKDEDRVTIKNNITPNELSTLSADSIILDMDNEAEVFQTFDWTSVDYGFNTSATYKVQVGVVGKNFANAIDVTVVTNLYTSTITVGDFNKILLNLDLVPGTPANLEFRVVAIINSNVPNVLSNTVKGVVTPYAIVFPPIYMCGSATGGWDWTKDVVMRSTAPSKYQAIAYFINNETFRFFKQAGWDGTSYNYLYFGGGFVSDSLADALDSDNNFKVLSPTGYYRMTVNLKTKIVDLDAVPEPLMFMTGAAVGGWDWSTNYVQMTWKSDGIFEAETEFINGEAFRFFAQKDWGPTSYNYPFFANGSVDALFENADDGDKNFKFVGTTGTYKVTVNMLDLIITMEEVTGK
jgi:hypothetical protein